MKMTPKKFYEKILIDRKYDSNIVESKFLKLNIDINQIYMQKSITGTNLGFLAE